MSDYGSGSIQEALSQPQDSMENITSSENNQELDEKQPVKPIVVIAESEATLVEESPSTTHNIQIGSSSGSSEVKMAAEVDASASAGSPMTTKPSPVESNSVASVREEEDMPAKRQRKPSRKEQESMQRKKNAAKSEEEVAKTRKRSKKSDPEADTTNDITKSKQAEVIEDKPLKNSECSSRGEDEKVEAEISEPVKPLVISSVVEGALEEGDDAASAQTTSDGEDNGTDGDDDDAEQPPPPSLSLLPTSSSASSSSSAAGHPLETEQAKSKKAEVALLAKELNQKLAPSHQSSSAASAASHGPTMSIAQVMKVVYTDADFADLSKDSKEQSKTKLNHAMDELNHHKQICDMLKDALKQSDSEYTRLGSSLMLAKEERSETKRIFEKGVANKRRKLSELREEEEDLIKEVAKLNKSRDELEQNSDSTIHQLSMKLEGARRDILEETKAAEDALNVIKDLQETQARGRRDALEQEKNMLVHAIEIKRAQVHLSMVQDLKLKDERSREFLMQVIRKRALAVDVNASVAAKSQ